MSAAIDQYPPRTEQSIEQFNEKKREKTNQFQYHLYTHHHDHIDSTRKLNMCHYMEFLHGKR